MASVRTKEYIRAQSKASRMVTSAIKKGELARPEVCELCGSKPGYTVNHSFGLKVPLIVGHHWNGYDDPLNVWWICNRCNHSLGARHDGSFDKE